MEFVHSEVLEKDESDDVIVNGVADTVEFKHFDIQSRFHRCGCFKNFIGIAKEMECVQK